MENKELLTIKHDLRFGAEDFDAKGNIKASSLMYAFQEIAADHANGLGLGFDDLMANNLIWVLSKVRFQVSGVIEEGKDYVLRTYPRPKKGVTFFRDYYLFEGEESEGKEPIAKGTSHWCIINFETRKIERAKVDFDGIFVDYEAFENGIEKFKIDQDTLVQFGVHKVVEDDLDDNEHVNNCRYADMVEEELSGFEECSIYYSKEALLGDEILLYKGQEGDYSMIEGRLADETVIFQVKTK